jgi:DNA-binding CsgD family transcriptional regulator
MDASMTDLLYYAEHPILKAHFHMRADEGYRWVPLDASRVARAAAYLDRRRTEAGTQQIVCGHPENGEVFRYELSGEESLLRIRDIGLRELQDRRSIVKLLVGETEEVLGLAVIWPITPHTVAKLREDRYTASYLRAQRPETLKQLLQNKSAFIRTIDIANMADDGLRHQSFGLMLDCLYEFDIIAASPPPVKFYEDSHRSVGFEPVSGAVHDAYGAAKWAQVYELQLQGSGFLDYAVRMLQGVEQPQAAAERSVGAGGGIAKPEEPLTEREAEIAGLMAEGRTNAEIAAEVYLSIVTVKKHVGAIYRKYGVTNRAQLMAKLLKG